ncbi:MAG: anthranilate synthase component I, partial [Treponema sp.]|nr:anthranilate synthase component I [Treponema sp.]
MNYAPGTGQFAALVQNYKRIPLWKTLDAGIRPPAETFRVLKNLSRQCFILESLEDTKQWGRYTFLGYDPRLEISCTGGVLRIKNGAKLEVSTQDPGSYISRIIEDNRSPQLPELPPFAGG